MAVVHMATFLVGYWAPLFRVFLCKPKEIQLPGNKEARLSLRSWLAEKFWFRIKTCVRWHFGFGARLSGKLCFRIKTFLERFWSKSKTFCSRNQDWKKGFYSNILDAKQDFHQKNGFEARDLSEKYERYANIWIQQDFFLFKHFVCLQFPVFKHFYLLTMNKMLTTIVCLHKVLPLNQNNNLIQNLQKSLASGQNAWPKFKLVQQKALLQMQNFA